MGRGFDFASRTDRATYWQFMWLAVALMGVAGVADHAFGLTPTAFAITGLVHLLPGAAVQVRRLHDGGRSGWWLLLALTGFGLVPLLVWFSRAGHPGPNRFDARRFHPPMATKDGLPYSPSLTTDPSRLAALSEARSSSPYPEPSSSFLSDSFLLLIGCAAVVLS